jgi:hypothetical protein
MKEQLQKLLDDIKLGEEHPEMREELNILAPAGEWAARMSQLSEKLIAASTEAYNPEHQYVYATATTVSLMASDEASMLASLMDASGAFSEVASMTLHVFLGFLLDEGYITINKMPELSEPPKQEKPGSNEDAPTFDWDSLMGDIDNDGDEDDSLVM